MGLFGNNDNNDEQNEQRMVPRTTIMCLVAAYLIYLGFNILRGWYQGDPGMPAWVAVLFGILFIVIGAVYMIYLLKPYLTKKSGEEPAALPESEEAAATPENEEPAAVLTEGEEPATELPEGEEPATAPAEDGEPAAVPAEDEGVPTSPPEKEGGK
jgi:hypothetical protein